MNTYKKYGFTNITVKKVIGDRFRQFAKQIPCSNTETLEAMLNFFEWHEISPHDKRDSKHNELKKRINAVIAILKTMEKHQTQPAVSMLQLLFEQAPTKPTRPKFVEIKQQQKNE